jgi:NitT/TauT family transport system ATP-binding protein
MPGASLAARSLCMGYQGREVLKEVSFELQAGRSLVLVGPSGCGKTTLMHILSGLLRPTGGEIEILPRNSPLALVRQDSYLFPWKTALENAELPFILSGLRAKERKRLARELLSAVGLADWERHWPRELSGGQLQRLGLARALAARPALLLLDEPFSALDAITREKMQLLLCALWKDYGLSLVLSTHSVEEGVFLGQDLLVLGGRPTRVLERFRNPQAGVPEFRDGKDYFAAVSQVRAKLWQSFSEDSAVLAPTAPRPPIP